MKRMLTTTAAIGLMLGLAGAAVAQGPTPPGPPPAGAPGMASRGPDFLPRAAAEERATELNRMLDGDRDGAVSRAEVDNWAKGKALDPGMVDSMFADADANRDGRITLAEQKADALRSFDAADTDHDGRMTGAERAAAEAKFAAEQPAAAAAKPLPVPTRRR